jgi:short-subunit dehydrogenase
MQKSIKKIVWITGASTGIGHALTCRYLRDGSTVVASSRLITVDHFPSLSSFKGQLDIMRGDVSKKADNISIINTILKKYGKIDLVILNAGTNRYVTVDEFDSDIFLKLINTNVLSVVYALEGLLPVMKNQEAVIGVVGSVVGYGGLPRASAYGATKAALRNMVQSLQIELYKKPLHLSLISPGFVSTPLTDLNDFKMPFIISADKAAQIIKRGLEKKKLEVHFPYRMSLLLKFIMSLPHKWMTWLLSRSVQV